MKKVLSVIVLVSFCSVFIFSQEETSLRELLNIDIKVTGYGTVNSLSPNFAVGSYTSVKKWTPYLGFTRISEPDFFSIAGYDKEAIASEKYAKKVEIWGWSGLGILAVGLSIFLSGLIKSYNVEEYSDEYWDTFDTRSVGASIVLVYLLPLGVSLYYAGNNWATVGQAQYVADEYYGKIKSYY